MRKAQHILEYAVLLCIVLAALLIMQVLVKRSYQGRLKQEADSVGQQYSPGHTSSLASSTTTTTSDSYTGGTTDEGQVIPEGMSISKTRTTTNSSKQESVGSFAVDQ